MNPIASSAVARWPGQFVRVVSLVASVVASSVLLIGWTLDKAILKSVVPGLATMKANTALSFILAGVALGLLRTERPGRTALIIGRISAGIVALIGLLSLGQDLFGLNLGIDELLVREVPEVAARTLHPGRPSPMTAFNFVLLGLGLLCLGIQWSRGPLVAQLLGMCGAAIALLALIGYSFGADALYQISPYSSMALHTAVIFLLLGCGIWLARPDRGIAAVVLTDAIGGLMARRLWPASVGAMLIFGFLQMVAIRTGIIPEAFGIALMVWGGILYATGIIVWTAASLNRADESVREQRRWFLAMLAHELRNPLAALDSGLALLADTHDAGDRDWALEMSMRQVRHLARMVDDLLDTSRITHGTIRLQMELVQPAKVIGRAVEAMRHLAEAKGHQLCVSMAPHLPKLEADPTRLEQIVSNLLINAIKFTQPGGRVEVSVQAESSTLVLTVRDTGAGIAPEFLSCVFDLFAQSDVSLAREHGGLGVGLTLVKALVEQHGGSVEARSEGLGHGSEFVVRFPTFDAAISPEIESVERRPPLDACRESALVRILMVEDNLEYARSLGRLLESAGYKLRISCDGPTALDEAHRWIPDVFLLDLGLPGMDGFEVARRIREDASFARAKVIVVSGYAGEEEHRRSKEIGIDAHLAKPVVLRDLLRTISDEDRASLA